ncbi:hypothetical protein ACLFMI_23795 [Pseudonocardia nantongensis]|uniref:hypothetical protein n=1 Tax=Pseudonocardia nantongensis TaxID=1181885 RepID=UPI0039792435
MPRTVRSRIAPLLGVLLVFAVLGGAVVWFADSRGFTTGDLWEIVDPPPPEECTRDDPTTSGCLTPTALRLHDTVVARFGEPGPDQPLRDVTCWSEHAWNPSSDHPAGRACDLFPGGYGEFPQGAELDAGWALADWLRANAADLRVRYVIWQGRIWYRGTGDSGEGRAGWGRPYNGGGVYDAQDATGGHYDHVHVSVRR